MEARLAFRADGGYVMPAVITALPKMHIAGGFKKSLGPRCSVVFSLLFSNPESVMCPANCSSSPAQWTERAPDNVYPTYTFMCKVLILERRKLARSRRPPDVSFI